MKKMLLSVVALTMIFGATLLTSCSKDDTTPPVVTLVGNPTVSVILGATYTELGATATDDKDGVLTSSIVTSGTVNCNLKGSYTVTYTVSDAAGNTGSATRTVNVVNSAEYLAGSYAVTDIGSGDTTGTWNYTVTVSTSSTTNNAFTIYNFGGFGATAGVSATISGTNITISGSISGMNPSPTIAGSGSASTTSGILNTSTATDFGSGVIENDVCTYAKTKK